VIGLIRASVVSFALTAGIAHAMPVSSPVPGGIAIVCRATPEGAPLPAAYLAARRLLVVPQGPEACAIVGIALDAKPGRHAVRWAIGAANVEQPFTVQAKAYPVQKLRIPDSRKVDPNPDDMRRINAEQPRLVKVREHWADVQPVDVGLQLPAQGPLSSRFGLRRELNGQMRSPHNGLDVAIGRGTPVHAAAAGVVAETGDFFFAGQTVFVDHGQGLVTMYAHLDQIGVQPGDRIARGQRLGASGMTGRVTGPHLHWTVYLNGTAVDPELFLKPAGQ